MSFLDRYPGCASRPWARLLNRVAVNENAPLGLYSPCQKGVTALSATLELGLTGEASARHVFATSKCFTALPERALRKATSIYL